MTTNYHTPISTGAAANSSVVNNPLAQLDAELTDQGARITVVEGDMPVPSGVATEYYDGLGGYTVPAGTGAGVDGHLVQDEGVDLPQRAKINFTGANIKVVDTAGATEVQISGADGWTADANAWTYASASTFTIAGDQTSVYKKGARVRWTQTTVRYGIVSIDSTYSSPNTTVTIIVNTDFVISNAAISANYYSYMDNPLGFPTWFNYDPAPLGWSTLPVTGVVYKYFTSGSSMNVFIGQQVDGGVSNATTIAFSTPVPSSANGAGRTVNSTTVDNSISLTVACKTLINSSYSIIVCYPDLATGLWTASGAKRVVFYLTYGW